MTSPLLPYHYCKENCLSLFRSDGALHLWYCDNTPDVALNNIQRVYGPPDEACKVCSDQIDKELILQFEQQSKVNNSAPSDFSDADLDSLIEETISHPDLLDDSEKSPIIKLTNGILTDAIHAQASDIHIEHFEQKLNIRYRIDGVLTDRLSPSATIAKNLISRLKILAKLDIAERRVPQDGRFTQSLGGVDFDFRLSSLPANQSERLVIRVLRKEAHLMELPALGLAATPLHAFEQALRQPHGIILLTGPTGSGKTTTLYAALNALNNGTRNIITVEDPIEYKMPGINQTQVNSKAGYTFAKGLKAILRQDPDVIMIGEIRDSETLTTAIQASLTGHLVLATLHTNSAVGAVTRLTNLGADPFLISTTLNGCASQRLLRKLCNHCKQPEQQSVIENFNAQFQQSVTSAMTETGCEHCQRTGFAGRLPALEFISCDTQFRSLIAKGANEAELTAHAQKLYPSIFTQALALAAQGETSLSEVARIAALPS